MVVAMGETRRTTPFVALTALCITGILATTGCSADGASVPTSSPTSTATNSDAAVLAGAIESYSRYSAAFDVALSAMPTESDYSQLKASVTPEYWKVLDEEFSSNDRTWYQSGSTAFENMSILDSSIDSGEVRVSALVCVDSTHVKLRDGAGAEVHGDDRSLRFSMHIDFEGSAIGELLVSDAYSADGVTACED